MLRHARLICLGLLAAAASGSVGCNQPVWWTYPNDAVKIADKEKRPILFYFKEWDSTHHRNMQVQVLFNPEVKRELLDTVNVELEFAYFDSYRKIYGVQKPQVCIMTDCEGNKVGQGLYVNPVPTVPQFLEWLREAKKLAKSANKAPEPAPASP